MLIVHQRKRAGLFPLQGLRHPRCSSCSVPKESYRCPGTAGPRKTPPLSLALPYFRQGIFIDIAFIVLHDNLPVIFASNIIIIYRYLTAARSIDDIFGDGITGDEIICSSFLVLITKGSPPGRCRDCRVLYKKGFWVLPSNT